jgi:hypothetical protein
MLVVVVVCFRWDAHCSEALFFRAKRKCVSQRAAQQAPSMEPTASCFDSHAATGDLASPFSPPARAWAEEALGLLSALVLTAP